MNKAILKIWTFLLFGVGTSCLSYAQNITAEQIFPVQGYSVFEQGYPLQVLPAQRGQFHFLEFWIGGNQGRTNTNYYLQTYRTFDYTESNFTEITPPETKLMWVKESHSIFERGVVVIGTQERGEDEHEHTVASFFDNQGRQLSEETVQLSTYPDKRRRNYEEWIRISPQGRRLLWIGHNGRDYHASLFDHRGEESWRVDLELPYLSEKYTLADAAVDDRGTPYLLMAPPSDLAGAPLMLLQLTDSARTTVEEVIMPAQGAFLMRAHLLLDNDSGLQVTGVVNQPNDSLRLFNGSKLEADEQLWSRFFLATYIRPKKPGFPLKQDLIHDYPVPERWVKHFIQDGGVGSNFSAVQHFRHENVLVMALEEQYPKKDFWFYYDLGLLAFDLETGELRWEKIITKQQRNRGTNEVLSYVGGIARSQLRLVFLTERGAQGKLNCTTLNMQTGERRDRYLASNETAQYLFFPRRSAIVNPREMVLIGLGNPGQNDYKLITVTF